MKNFFAAAAAIALIGFSGVGSALALQMQQPAGDTLSLTLATGRVGTVDLGGSGWSIVHHNNPMVAKASLNGSVVTVNAEKPGFASLTACSADSGACSNISLTVSAAPQAAGNVLGASTFRNGSLVIDAGTVYAVYKNTKIPFADMTSLTGLGYSIKNAAKASAANLADSGQMVTSASGAHPFGSWIKQGKTVYFIHDLGLIPVPDWNTFLANGGSDKLIVPANARDMQLLLLRPMVKNDNRLQ